MKKRWKLISLFAVLFTLISVTCFVFAESANRFYLELESSGDVTDLKNLKHGDEVKLNVMMDAKDWTTNALKVSYDPKVFEFVEADSSYETEFVKSYMSTVNSSPRTDGEVEYINFATTLNAKTLGSTNTKDYAGSVGSITLRVKDTASGDYNISVQVTEFQKLTKKGDGGTPSTYAPIEDYKTENAELFVKVPVTDINLTNDSLDIVKGQVAYVDVIPNPQNTTDAKNLSTSITQGNGVVSVTNNGLVEEENHDVVIEGLKTGTSKIQVQAYGKTKELTVNVTTPLQRISFADTDVMLSGVNAEKTLTPIFDPVDADNQTLKWTSSVDNVATVDQSGKVVAKNIGTTVIKAESQANPEISASVTVRVVIPVTNVTIDQNKRNLNKGAETDISLEYTPKEAKPTITWRSEQDSIATVDDNGHVKAVSGGDTNVVVTLTDCTAQSGETCTYSIPIHVEVPLEDIKIMDNGEEVSNIELYINQSTNKLNVVLEPADTTIADKTVTWTSSADQYVSVEDGVIKALKATTDPVTITAQVGSVQKTVSVVVKTPVNGESGYISPNTEVTLEKVCDSSKSNCEKQFQVLFTPEEADEVPVINWESTNTSVATVDKNGKVVAVGVGDTDINASYQTVDGTNKTLTAKVHVIVPLESITFAKSNITVHRNDDPINIPDITIAPKEASQVIDGKVHIYTKDDITYNVTDNTVAKYENGKISGLKIDTTTLKATLGDKEAELTVKVDAPIKSVKITNDGDEVEEIDMNRDDVANLDVIIDPSDTTDDTTVTWTVSGNEKNVIDLSTSGTVTAKNKGTVTVTATVAGVKKSITINVSVPVTSFTATESDITMYKGEANKKLIGYTILPEDADDDKKKITWEIDDDSVVKIENGYLIGLKAGNTQVTGTLSDGKSITIDVTVNIIPLDDIEVNIDDEILKGHNQSIVITPDPIDSTELENIKYESSDEDIFEVSDNGVIRGKKAGTATLTITVGDIVKKIEITIKEINAESITVKVEKDVLSIGEELPVDVMINPTNSTDELTYTYKSSDESILTVDELGVIKAIKAGKATITVTASNGLTSSVEITVMAEQSNVPTLPQTNIASVVPNIIISIISLIGILFIGYKKYSMR